MIYFDNAATTWPKPESVYKAVDLALREYGGNPGRGNHSMSHDANRIVYEARIMCSKLFHAPNPESICFTSNATESLNLAIKGTLRPGDHVITGQMEHNSVSRPLKKIKSLGVSVTKIVTSPEWGIDLEELEKAFRNNTRLVICNHVSNVTGTINPIREIGRMCREREILFLVDAAQSAGMFNIDVQDCNIDMLAFPGHKGLLGPQGTGGLYIRNGLILETLKEGGTGTQSELSDQPANGPERYESGTINLPGLAGMAEGIKYILSVGQDNIEKKEEMLTGQLLKGLAQIEGVKVFGPGAEKPRGSVVSITLENANPEEASIVLDNTFHIAARAGLHCARDAHETLGTIAKGGTLRFSPGCFNTAEEIVMLIEAVGCISQEI